MWYKQSDLNKAIKLIEQKKSLQQRLTLAVQKKRTFSIRLIQLQLSLVNQKWRNAAIKLIAGNDTEY